MNEKRFKIEDGEYGGESSPLIYDYGARDEDYYFYNDYDDFKALCDRLNELAEENKKLKQFKEQVFALIDKKLEENEKLNGVDTAMYYANKGTLNELKKELFE